MRGKQIKTPREILLARHQAAGPKLNAIRREVVEGLNHQDTKARSWPNILASWCLGGSEKIWLELVWPCRRILTGLATVWVLLFIINFSQRDNVSSITGKPIRSGEVMMSVQAQQRWVNELLADRSMPPEAERPKIFIPKPRTEIIKILIV